MASTEETARARVHALLLEAELQMQAGTRVGIDPMPAQDWSWLLNWAQDLLKRAKTQAVEVARKAPTQAVEAIKRAAQLGAKWAEPKLRTAWENIVKTAEKLLAPSIFVIALFFLLTNRYQRRRI